MFLGENEDDKNKPHNFKSRIYWNYAYYRFFYSAIYIIHGCEIFIFDFYFLLYSCFDSNYRKNENFVMKIIKKEKNRI